MDLLGLVSIAKYVINACSPRFHPRNFKADGILDHQEHRQTHGTHWASSLYSQYILLIGYQTITTSNSSSSRGLSLPRLCWQVISPVTTNQRYVVGHFGALTVNGNLSFTISCFLIAL